jgi:hypothetical protein
MDSDGAGAAHFSPTDKPARGASMTVYLYHCPHCTELFAAQDYEVDAMNDGIKHYHATGHQIGEIRHFDGTGQTDGELYEGQQHGQHVHTQHVDHHQHGHHEHHQHGHHGHHQEPHIF